MESSKEGKLLLREKDYQFLIMKGNVVKQIALNDPLINPQKKKNTKRKGKILGAPLTEKNPLRRVSQMPIRSNIQPVANPAPFIEEEGQKINEGTPWETILKNFLKVYDYRRQPVEIKLTNVFGSQGVKMEEELQQAQAPQRASRLSLLPEKKSAEKKTQATEISLKTYLKILDNMKKDLRFKWSRNDKVASLQITIQSCKLLHDTSHAKFHALKFAYVMEIIEEFGMNVYQRIKKLSFPDLSKQRLEQISIKDLEGANIPEAAQEICRNWINKISSIRELIPRIFVETTLIRLYFFLDNGAKAEKVLKRLAKSNRCFGQYINCIFFCTFLIRMGKQVLPQNKDFILDILDDVFYYIKQGKTKFNRQDICYDEFFNILEPFFVSSFESLAESLTRDKFKRLCVILPQNPHHVILKNFILSFSPSLLVNYSVDIAKILQKVYRTHKYPIYRLLLDRLSGVKWSQSGEFIVLVWTDISEVTQLEVMLDLLEPLSEIIFCNLPRYEKNKIYSLILEKFNDLFYNFRRINKSIYGSFQRFLNGIVKKTENITDILTLEPFLQIISYFPTQNKKEISENISKTFLQRDQKINDPVIVHIMLSLMKNMKGMKIKALTLKFLEKVDFQNDFQQNLNFLAQMRSIFGYIPELTIALIYKAVSLTFLARKLAKGKITKKLVSFLQATIAYCFITVPVLQSHELKLKMYLYLSEIAMANNLISQATSLIKTCITQLAQVSNLNDFQTFGIFKRILSVLIVIPDDPESDYLFLFNGLFQAFTISKLKTNFEKILRFEFYVLSLHYLSCQAQERLPFHIEGVVSNDGLFKNQQFKIALIEKIHQIIQLLENTLKGISILQGKEIDEFILQKLGENINRLLTIFQVTGRITNFIKQCIRLMQKCRERLKKDEKKNGKKYDTLLISVNTKMRETGLKLKI